MIPSPRRQGMVAVAALLMLAAGGMLALRDAAIRSERATALLNRMGEIQGRELALGAAACAVENPLTVGRWQVVRERSGECRATSTMGTCTIEPSGRIHWRKVQGNSAYRPPPAPGPAHLGSGAPEHLLLPHPGAP